MKKWLDKNKYGCFCILVLFLIMLWYFWSYFRAGLPITHDGENHVARFAQYYLALRQGQFPPRLGPMLENGFGYPVFNYNYPLANILSLPLSFLHISFEWQFKIIIITFFILGAIAVYQWWHCLSPRRQNWLIPIFAFILAPYLWSAIWYRGNIGEVIMYLLIPVVCWQIERYRAGRRFAATTLVLSLAAFFLAHNVLVLFASPLIIAYAWWRLRQSSHNKMLIWLSSKIKILSSSKHLFGKSQIWPAFGLALIAVGLSVWFWFPAFFEKNLVVLDTAGLNQEYRSHFATWHQLLSFAPTTGLSQAGSIDGLSFGVGLVFFWTWSLTAYYCLRRQRAQFYHPRLAVILLLLSLFLLWLQTSSSTWLWAHVPLVNFIQFPWRLGLLMQLITALMLANLRDNTTLQKSFWCVLLGAQLLIYTHARPTTFFAHEQDYYLTYPMSTTTSRENTPITFTWDISQEMGREPLVATGSGHVTSATRLDTTRKDYTLTCDANCLIIEPTAYFPGFQTTVDNQLVHYFDEATIGGRIAFIANTGEHTVETRFTQNTPARVLGNVLSVISIIITAFIFYQETKTKK